MEAGDLCGRAQVPRGAEGVSTQVTLGGRQVELPRLRVRRENSFHPTDNIEYRRAGRDRAGDRRRPDPKARPAFELDGRIDGKVFRDHCMVIALGIDTQGRKHAGPARRRHRDGCRHHRPAQRPGDRTADGRSFSNERGDPHVIGQSG